MLQILTSVQVGILIQIGLGFGANSFDSLLQLDLNLIGLAFFDFIVALVKVKSNNFLLCANPLI